MKTLRSIERVVDVICNIMTGIGAIMMAALTLDVFVQVIFRYFLQMPIAVSTELTTIFFPWIVCMAMVVIARRNENTALVLFFDKFKGVARHIAVIFVDLVMIEFSVFMAMSAYSLSMSLANEILPLTGLSKAVNYGSMVVGFIGVTIMVGFNLIEYILVDIVKIGEKGGEVK
ncbi:MAG: TRAP transporter small permease [Lawsonibacter sp.]|jgi:TRAP-type C4-dicarboxylate transport system permease small subunit